MTEFPCKYPPPGWRCTREEGHEGPCAAHPVALRDIGENQRPDPRDAEIERLRAEIRALKSERRALDTKVAVVIHEHRTGNAATAAGGDLWDAIQALAEHFDAVGR